VNRYLVVFDRSRGSVLRSQRYSDPGKALEARFAEERERRGETLSRSAKRTGRSAAVRRSTPQLAEAYRGRRK
jgi:hypothetical protein